VIGLVLAAVAWAAPPLDLNAATAEQLELLPSVGPVRAAAFLEWRAAHGRCASLDDLAAVPGFGAATLTTLEGRAWCGSHDGVATKLTAAGPAVGRPETIDVNTATVDELQWLPGIVETRARAIVDAATHYNNPQMLVEVSMGLGDPMVSLDVRTMDDSERMAVRGW